MIILNLTSLFLTIVMTHIRNTYDDLHNKDVNGVPTQKLEWVTPKISLMGAGSDTEGNKFVKSPSESNANGKFPARKSHDS